MKAIVVHIDFNELARRIYLRSQRRYLNGRFNSPAAPAAMYR